MAAKSYWVYLVECAGGVVYTGIAVDPQVRFRQHLSGRGAAFTRIRKPLRILGMRKFSDRGTALRVERAVRKLSPPAKRKWAADALSI